MVYLLPILAVLLSLALVLLLKLDSQKNIKLILAFSGAFLLALTFFELLPEVYRHSNPRHIAIFILIGILLQVFLEFFSKGAEHGHMHLDMKDNGFPWLLFLSLSLHALIEGVPIRENNDIIYGILIHKVPVAMILAIFLVNSKLKIGVVIIFMALFALMTPFGSYLSVHTNFAARYGTQLTALAIGVLLHVSTVILFESTQEHTFNLRKLLVILLGIIGAYFL
ncbi:MAG: ZIP family metal transporter [Bacteroidota bacterium]